MNRRKEKGACVRFAAVLLWVVAFLSSFECLAQTNLVLPAGYLASLPKPKFAPGQRLPHLTRWGWQLSSNACIEVATNWGYSLDLGECASWMVPSIGDTSTMIGRFIALAKQYPTKFALSGELTRSFPDPVPKGFYCTNAQGLFVDQNNVHQWADATNTQYSKVISPVGPDDYWATMAESQIAPFRAIRSNAPIAMILNGGEYGLDVSGFGAGAWEQVPAVGAVSNQPAGGLTWPQYASNQKARQLGFLTKAVRQVLPDREMYVFYNTSCESSRTVRYQPWTGPDWSYLSFPGMATNTDLPNFQCYYNGSWTNAPFVYYGQYSFTPDLLTEYLNSVGYYLARGYSTNYTWVCGGWDQGNGPTDFSDIPRYMGFLKCLYTGGMIGGVAGAFSYPTNGFDVAFTTNNPPYWLTQMVALSRVHALFSYLSDYLYDGDLLSGPQMHSMSTDQPAYEFTNTVADATARVLVRKLHNSNQWLITAWAQAGANRNVTVNIPVLGAVTVQARDCGTVYVATPNSLVLKDPNGLFPTEYSVSAPPANFRLSAPSPSQ